MLKFFIYASFISFLLCLHQNTAAQTPRLIEFADKNNSPFSLQRPQEFLSEKAINRRNKQKISLTTKDLPVNPAYLDAIRQAGGQVRYPLKWSNSCVVICNDAVFNTIRQLSFVKSAKQLSETLRNEEAPKLFEYQALKSTENPQNAGRTEENYGISQRQIAMLGINDMHDAGYTGKGMTIAVFDSGFPNVDVNKLSSYSRMNILGTYNYVYSNNLVYGYDPAGHGTNVLSLIAAYRPQELIGGAFEASYYLFITEDVRGNLDDPIEETNWAAAAERADSLGVDIINSSLGYNYFNNSAFNYKQTDLNGKTSIISRAAATAAATGMIVVSSAGNLFEREWTKIKMPADADSILAVGAVNSESTWIATSLQGNTTDGRVKPDVAALGSGVVYAASFGVTTGSGTSYAAPLVAGLVAGLWQANPTKTNLEIMDMVRKSASKYAMPDTQVGYGIPNYKKAMMIVSSDEQLFEEQAITLFPNPTAADKFYLQFDEKYLLSTCEITLTDLSGKIIWTHQLAVSQTKMPILLPKNSLSNGVYLVQIKSKKFNVVKKLVVEF
jgi:serine protease AprX